MLRKTGKEKLAVRFDVHVLECCKEGGHIIRVLHITPAEDKQILLTIGRGLRSGASVG